MTIKPFYFYATLTLAVLGIANAVFHWMSDVSPKTILELSKQSAAETARADLWFTIAQEKQRITDSLMKDRGERMKTFESLADSAENLPSHYEIIHTTIRNHTLEQDLKFMSDHLPKTDPYHR